ncbi:hypothetical protein OH807_03310 [Kitasatospora sp. NBC_01560]|uniref:hypothetical protein n=1 Tax=Kitasatospora sp. NBC_01560 TaxID=2975965 RepID=UPI003864E52B
MTAITAALAVTAAPAAVAARPGAGLHGWARLDPAGPVPGEDRLTLAVDATARHRAGAGGAAEARGHVTIQHAFPNGDGTFSTSRMEIAIDCLITRGRTTSLTGVVESVTITVPPGYEQPPGSTDSWHPETAFSFYTEDGGQRRIGWRIPRFGDPTAPPAAARCVAPTVDASDFYLVEGGFTVRR